jgi:hypothetical protein
LDRLLAAGEAIVRLVPKGGIVCHAELGVYWNVLGGVDFHPICGWVSVEFTVICLVIEAFPVVWPIAGVVIHDMWVELGVGIGAPHVMRCGDLGEFGRDLMGVGGVYTNKFAAIWIGSASRASLWASCCSELNVLSSVRGEGFGGGEARGWVVEV